MPLPQDDPSLPGGAAPLFSDTDAARGDHLRANNQSIWEDLQYLDDGENINDADAATPVDADKSGFYQIAGTIIKYVTFANLFLCIVTKFYALASKTTPADADRLFITDSAASNVGKSLTWANLKATLKTYFDGLYPTSAAGAVAWVNFDGTAASPITPNTNFNVSTITKNSTGDYTVNFSSNLASANYAACVTVKGDGGAAEGIDITSQSASAFRFVARDINGYLVDCSIVNVIVFGG